MVKYYCKEELKLKKNTFGKTLIQICLYTLTIFLLNACDNVEKVEHIEVFIVETSEQNKEGLFEKTGYKKVNSITTIEEGKNYIETDIKAVEDFYDIDGNYLKTEIIHSTFNKSNVTQEEAGEDRKEEIHNPSTILIPTDYLEHFQLKNMTREEEEKVKEHVLSFVKRL